MAQVQVVAAAVPDTRWSCRPVGRTVRSGRRPSTEWSEV